jgi:hypothetical protein
MKYLDLLYLQLASIFKKVYLYQDVYNSQKIPLILPTTKRRSCKNRIIQIRKFLKVSKQNGGSYLDIGSQIGYFVFKMAEMGYYSIGIEQNSNSVHYARTLANYLKMDNVSFSQLELNPTTVKSLPKFDVISILNVYHHLLHFQGRKNADSIMKTLASKTNKVLFFESGQPEEKGLYWSDGVKKVSGDNYDKWAVLFLKSLGFKKVIKIGNNSTHLNKARRSLFAAIK